MTVGEVIRGGFRRSRISMVKAVPLPVALSVAWLLAVLSVAVLAQLLTPYDHTEIDLRARLQPPAFLGGEFSHILGTDQLGRDVLSRLFISIQMSFLIATTGTIIGAVVGTVLGFVAAHYKGFIDDVVIVLVDFQAAMPFTILALAVLAFFGNDLMLFVAVLGLYGWERYARLARGMTLSARSEGYAMALEGLGCGFWRLYLRHILPNIASVLIVNMTVNFPETILLESALSFLGLGIQPPMTSVGSMLGFGRDYLSTAWWIAVFPGLTIVFSVLALSIVGDWLQERLDPRVRAL